LYRKHPSTTGPPSSLHNTNPDLDKDADAFFRSFEKRKEEEEKSCCATNLNDVAKSSSNNASASAQYRFFFVFQKSIFYYFTRGLREDDERVEKTREIFFFSLLFSETGISRDVEHYYFRP